MVELEAIPLDLVGWCVLLSTDTVTTTGINRLTFPPKQKKTHFSTRLYALVTNFIAAKFRALYMASTEKRPAHLAMQFACAPRKRRGPCAIAATDGGAAK
ncbi:hypothetical protein EVAR_51023_1 [Eumeta japonica]|uniref:Uncharacterized protein n=1 Tax=Eumeta variegata TaxID=151549 RepID=A0A4C1Y758_EUMVA|nr:hypothetical protein EVAR_51023_1 [Eumeta japonica]